MREYVVTVHYSETRNANDVAHVFDDIYLIAGEYKVLGTEHFACFAKSHSDAERKVRAYFKESFDECQVHFVKVGLRETL